MTMSRREGKKELETIPIVPQMLITPEIFLTWKLCLGRNREQIRQGQTLGPGDKSQGFMFLDILKFYTDSKCNENCNPHVSINKVKHFS